MQGNQAQSATQPPSFRPSAVTEKVRQRYARIAAAASQAEGGATPDGSTASPNTSCCSGARRSATGCCNPVVERNLAPGTPAPGPRGSGSQERDTSDSGTGDPADPISSVLYTPEDLEGLPQEAAQLSLGCGNPLGFADLRPGEVVLDLGSGAGLDALLAARLVGPTGKVYGLDMTDEMLALAERNRLRAGATNVQFLKGYLEAIPLPDRSFDVILSNCVLNLSADKARAFAEAFRVLKPGGRLAISDMVHQGEIPQALLREMELWAGCVAGSLEVEAYQRGLEQAGFVDVRIRPARVHRLEQLEGAFPEAARRLREAGVRLEAFDGRFFSAAITARRPLKPEGPKRPAPTA